MPGDRKEEKVDKCEIEDGPCITAEKLKQLIDSGEKPVIIDIRGNSAYASHHIPGAINIPVNAAEDPLEREMKLMTLPGDRLLIPYCD